RRVRSRVPAQPHPARRARALRGRGRRGPRAGAARVAPLPGAGGGLRARGARRGRRARARVPAQGHAARAAPRRKAAAGVRSAGLARLELRRADLPPYEVVLAGRGISFEAAVLYVERKKLERVTFTGAIPYSDAPRLLSSAHVVLGAFGGGDKAGRVIPHKVYQGLAAGRAVLT